MRSVAVHFPGILDFRFYSGDEVVRETKNFHGPSDIDNFIGLTLDESFDGVEIVDTFGFVNVEVDNLYFSPIPAPGVLMPPALAAAARGGGRRRG